MQFSIAVLLFLTGSFVCLSFADLPDAGWCWFLLLSAPLCIIRTKLVLFAYAITGLLWTLAYGHYYINQMLPVEFEGQDIEVLGTIANLPVAKGRATRFQFRVESFRHQGKMFTGPDKIMLSWYGKAPELIPSDRWRFTVRLKRPHGYRNPGGFDYEKQLFQQGIRATGYVRTKSTFQKVSGTDLRYLVHRIRYVLSEQMQQAIGASEYIGVMKALSIGDRADISKDQWSTFTNTGTNHLVAISGLHIGLLAGLGFFLGRFCWSRFHFGALRFPAQKAGGIVALLFALLYAALAGFAIPTQRALIMTAAALWSLLSSKRYSLLIAFSLALLLVIIVDPFSILSPGFWLSFGAVAAIVLAMSGRLRATGLWWKWGRVQWIVSLALIPILLLLFQKFSIVSPLANLFAVPWVSFVIVPLTLLATLVSILSVDWATHLFWLVNLSIDILWWVLEWFGDREFAVWSQASPAAWTLLPAVLGLLLLLAPSALPARWMALILLLPLFLVESKRPADGEAWFTLLDVGQGLAAAIQTSQHLLIYDTGPKFSPDFDTGSSVVIPFVRQTGMPRVDKLIISHGDMDHRGGFNSVMRELDVSQVLTSEPALMSRQDTQPCNAGDHWIWDGIKFEILHPANHRQGSENDRSCVMRVSTQEASILLTGDIERAAEQVLVANYADRLKADVLVAPHHGSKTSSTDEFLRVIDPDAVLFPVGYRNRFGFPKPEVIKRYDRYGVEQFETATTGAIQYRLGPNGISTPRFYRLQQQRFWHTH